MKLEEGPLGQPDPGFPPATATATGSAPSATSKNQLTDYCSVLIAGCREELAELRSAVRTACSHREKSAELLTTASQAVALLEKLFYSDCIDVEKLRVLQQRAVKVHAALDRAEAVVKVYGQMSGLGKVWSKVTTPNAVSTKYQAVSNELRMLNEALTRDLGLAEHQSMQNTSASTVASTTDLVGPNPGLMGSSPSTILPPVTSRPLGASLRSNGSEGMMSLPFPGVMSVDSREHSVADFTTLSSLEPIQLHKPSRKDAITGLAFVSRADMSEATAAPGMVWMYINRLFGTDKLVMCDLASGIESPINNARPEGPVTTMNFDSRRGLLWTGHRYGAVMAWDEVRKAPLCPSTRVCSSAVRTMTIDEMGGVWAGSDKGHVRRVVVHQGDGSDGLASGMQAPVDRSTPFSLVASRSLRHTGTGGSERNPGAEVDRVTQVIIPDLRAKEKAHEGPVAAILAAAGRVWTTGGSSAFVCLREWTQRGEFINRTDLKQLGGALSMTLVSPIVRVGNLSSDRVTASVQVSTVSVVTSPQSTEVTQTWQLVTGHGNGILQVWGLLSGLTVPLLRIGSQQSPVTSLAVCGSLGMLCTSHLDGKLRLYAVPNPVGSSALTVTPAERSVSAVKLPSCVIKAADAGIAVMQGGGGGLVTAAHDGSVAYWPNSSLRKAIEGTGLATYPASLSSLRWPFRPLDAIDVTLAIEAAHHEQQLQQLNHQQQQQHSTASSQLAGGMESALKLTDDAKRWHIDYKDLTLSRMIGQGAFGKVYLGKWQETDVAIKVLSSLAVLGFAPSEKDVALVQGTNVASDDDNGDGTKVGDEASNVSEAIRTLQREVGLMVAMRHPNVILFMGLCPDPPCVVTEYCSRGSLYDVLRRAREDSKIGDELKWSRRLGMALDAAKGMLYLHSHKPPIIHRDLKSPNLLVDRHWRVKVTDFNLSRLSETVSTVASSVVADNPRWHAPEIIRNHRFSAAGDVYAFGIVLWELATWELPFDGMSPFQIILAVGEKGMRPELEHGPRGGGFNGYEDYVALMEACWAQNPEERPAFEHIIASLRAIAQKSAQSSAGREDADKGSALVQKASVGGEELNSSSAKSSALDTAQPSISPMVGGPFNQSPFDFSTTQPNLSVSTNPSPSPFDFGVSASPFDFASNPIAVQNVPQYGSGTHQVPGLGETRSDSASEIASGSENHGVSEATNHALLPQKPSDIRIVDSAEQRMGRGRLGGVHGEDRELEKPPSGNRSRGPSLIGRLRSSLSRRSNEPAREGGGSEVGNAS